MDLGIEREKEKRGKSLSLNNDWIYSTGLLFTISTSHTVHMAHPHSSMAMSCLPFPSHSLSLPFTSPLKHLLSSRYLQ